MNLELAGVAFDRHGIKVDARLRTTNKKIFAIGDAIGGYQFTHVGNYHAGIVIRNALFRLPAKVDYRALPWVTYTDPELAHVGLTEAQAREQGHAVEVLRWPFEENDRARTERQTQGLIKAVVGKGGRILGASIVGAHAGELILPWVLAIRQKLKIGALADVIVPYPTLGEVSKRAAGELLHAKTVRASDPLAGAPARTAGLTPWTAAPASSLLRVFRPRADLRRSGGSPRSRSC